MLPAAELLAAGRAAPVGHPRHAPVEPPLRRGAALAEPQPERSATFTLGSWRFDPDNVGYRDETCENGFVFDTALPGNSNAGHEYGTGADGLPALDEAARRAVVEYLKTL